MILLALYPGHRVHIDINHRQMLKLVGTLLLISGGSLLVKVCKCSPHRWHGMFDFRSHAGTEPVEGSTDMSGFGFWV